MMRAFACLLAVAGLTVPAGAQYMSGPGDGRIQQIYHMTGTVIPLRVSVGYQLTVGFSPDERIESVAVGDTGAWQVTANKRGDYLFVKPTAVDSTTNMTVVTDTEVYSFDLSSADGGGNTPYLVRILSQSPATALPMSPGPRPIASAPGRYRLGGKKALRPKGISDDGRQTFIEWGEDTTLPAVYGVGRGGDEILTNGEMIGGRFVLDTVYERLVFRLDRDAAHATRLKPRPQGARP